MIICYSCEPLKVDPDNVAESIEDTWSCQEQSTLFGSTKYNVEIQKEKATNNMLLYNFYQLGDDEYAVFSLDGYNLKLNEQYITGILVSGSGIVSRNMNEITINFNSDDGGEKDNVSLTLTRLY